jgi:hypothetical protein
MDEDLILPAALVSILQSIDAVVQKGSQSGATPEIQVHLTSLMRMASLSVVALSGLPKCQLASPHKDIQTGFDSSGNLRLECLHSPMHCWDLTGHQGPC